MRTYGKRFFRRKRQREALRARETKNAIIWSIDEVNRKANVRIHGSNTTISAFFPTSWYSMPDWVKIGAPAKILFSGGRDGIIELVSPGTVIPYPQTGQVWPDAPIKPNHISSGLSLMPIPNRKRMVFFVRVGACFIANNYIEIDAISMGDGDHFMMGDGTYMGEIAGAFAAVTPADPPNNYPLDRWYINNVFINGQGTIYTQFGDGFQTISRWQNERLKLFNTGQVVPFPDYVFPDSVDPPTPANNLKIGYVVTWEGQTELNVPSINWLWRVVPYEIYSREPVMLYDATPEGNYINWGDTTCTIRIEALDNRGEWWRVNQEYYLKVEIMSGNGGVRDNLAFGIAEEDNPYSTTCRCINMYDPFSGKYYPIFIISYKRDGLVTDESPTLKCTLEVDNGIEVYTNVSLFDASGNLMTG